MLEQNMVTQALQMYAKPHQTYTPKQDGPAKTQTQWHTYSTTENTQTNYHANTDAVTEVASCQQYATHKTQT